MNISFIIIVIAGILFVVFTTLLLLKRGKKITHVSEGAEGISSKLSKTRNQIFGRITSVIKGETIGNSELGQIEEILITSDVGVPTTERLLQGLRDSIDNGEISGADSIKTHLLKQIEKMLNRVFVDKSNEIKPYVILVVGVNGVGKTTTIAKIAKKYLDQNKSVLLAAGDTFRAAAIDQLKAWGDKLKIQVISQQTGTDSAAVIYNAIESAKAKNINVIIADTAGRLHTKANLMDELKKIDRVIKKVIPDAPHETLLVLDATTGQNAFQQVKIFKEAIQVTGLIVTKLDGTAKGGVIIGIVDQYQIPVRYIGVGEKMEDLKDFDYKSFTEAICS